MLNLKEPADWKVISTPPDYAHQERLILESCEGLEGIDFLDLRDRMLHSVRALKQMIEETLGEVLTKEERKSMQDVVLAEGLVFKRKTVSSGGLVVISSELWRADFPALSVTEEFGPNIYSPVRYRVPDPDTFAWLVGDFPEILGKWKDDKTQGTETMRKVRKACETFLKG